jgi:hypothetical protein
MNVSSNYLESIAKPLKLAEFWTAPAVQWVDTDYRSHRNSFCLSCPCSFEGSFAENGFSADSPIQHIVHF